VPLSGWPTDVTLLDLEVWDRLTELNIVEVPAPNPPPPHPRAMQSPLGAQPPRKWVITTDVESVHHGGGGGGGTPGTDRLLAWHATIAPTVPDRVRALTVQAQAPGATGHATIELPPHPIVRRPAAVDHEAAEAEASPDCASCGPPAREPAPP
jgi:hypothetical protein